jgi:hypothetical protein
MMNQQQEIMVFAIGVGVGVAAVIGTLKFLYNVSLKYLIAAALLPTLAGACYMQWWASPNVRCRGWRGGVHSGARCAALGVASARLASLAGRARADAAN